MKTVEDFLFDLPGHEKQIVSVLRNIILNCSDRFREKISYGVPYYFLNTRVCFIWPSSIKPGPKEGVVLGFCKGYLLSNEQGVLEKENRKEVYMITFRSANEIKPDLIRELVHEAIMIDLEDPPRSKMKAIR